ncbi:hypothetical protein L1049_021592 [Liquidambar formosana]|uniref:Uncharacterized protein n=1 Tax=Liquidambar formosana TaxID=63359 RepID=A0AAP0N2L1_LIQFO
MATEEGPHEQLAYSYLSVYYVESLLPVTKGSAIPQSLSSLTFLSFLNFSCNNLSGRIPLSTQLQSFSEESYAGNLELCGVPLSKKCVGDGDSEVPPPSEYKREGEDDGDMLSWFYISMMPGFVVGFWGVCGVLYFKKSWRYAYSGFLDNIKDGIYVAIALKLVWLQKKVKRNHVGE